MPHTNLNDSLKKSSLRVCGLNVNSVSEVTELIVGSMCVRAELIFPNLFSSYSESALCVCGLVSGLVSTFGGLRFSLRYSKYVKLKTWFSVLACWA
jgi:hypothetical protein